MCAIETINGKQYRVVYAKYKRVNGKIVYPKRAKAFRMLFPL